MEGTGALLAAGGKALGDGDWVAARGAFDESVGIEDTAEGLAGLGNAHWWLGGDSGGLLLLGAGVREAKLGLRNRTEAASYAAHHRVEK